MTCLEKLTGILGTVLPKERKEKFGHAQLKSHQTYVSPHLRRRHYNSQQKGMVGGIQSQCEGRNPSPLMLLLPDWGQHLKGKEGLTAPCLSVNFPRASKMKLELKGTKEPCTGEEKCLAQSD